MFELVLVAGKRDLSEGMARGVASGDHNGTFVYLSNLCWFDDGDERPASFS